MNKVTSIHLGRQAFNISAEAHGELRAYLAAIKKQVGDEDVLNEVELRMAELLDERGVKDKKVILPADVEFLKQQLGDPGDFKEDDAVVNEKLVDGKRLFRDTNNAMVAGVAAGLAEYFGLDVLLVRILFVLSVFIWGWGILLYLVLWLLVPEAKTSSDRLRMAGKAVTVSGLKEVVERADVKGAAKRANSSVAGPINAFFRIILKVVGFGLVASGLAALFGLIAGEAYVLLHGNNLLVNNIFPVGVREHVLLHIGFGVAALASILVILLGMAIFRRKWPIRPWATGVLIGLIFIGLAIGGALTADTYPNIRDRYNANVHTIVRQTKPFTAVTVTGDGVDINYLYSSKYYVSLNYYDHPNLGSIKTNVINGVLNIDSSQFDWHRRCQTICIPDTYNMVVTVYSPLQSDFGFPMVKPAPYPDNFNPYP